MAPKTKTTQVKSAEPESVVENTDVKPVVVETPVAVAVAVADDVTTVEVVVTSEIDKFAQILDKLQSFINDAKEMTVLVKTMQKEHQKLQKQTTKKIKKTGGEVSKRSPSGFAKPTKLSDDLCNFLGETVGSSMARTIVTKHINEYIKKHSLQDQSDKRHIIPDAKLKSILSISEGDKLTYFNLQTYIKQHFKKDVVVEV
jgi:chromatin remodeling complex protein RSC6